MTIFFSLRRRNFYREIGYFADDTFCYKINQLSGCCSAFCASRSRPTVLLEWRVPHKHHPVTPNIVPLFWTANIWTFRKRKTKNEPKKCKMPHQINHWWLRVVLVERVDGCPLFQTCPLHRQQNHKIHSNNNKLWLIVILPVVLWQRGHHSFTHHGSFVRSVVVQVQTKKTALLLLFLLFLLLLLFLWCLLIVCCCICVKEWWSFAVDSPFVAVNSILSPECEKEYHTGEVRSPSGLWTKIFNVDSNRFHTLTCSGCGFTQMFKTQQSMLANLIDLVIR